MTDSLTQQFNLEIPLGSDHEAMLAMGGIGEAMTALRNSVLAAEGVND